MADDTARSAADMTPAEFTDFIDELYVLVQEQGHIWEAPGPVTDYFGTQNEIRHGPWQQADCARVLRAWHESGLLGVYEDGPNGTTRHLDVCEVTLVLSMSEPWTPGTAHLLLYPTETGDRRQLDRWRATAGQEF